MQTKPSFISKVITAMLLVSILSQGTAFAQESNKEIKIATGFNKAAGKFFRNNEEENQSKVIRTSHLGFSSMFSSGAGI